MKKTVLGKLLTNFRTNNDMTQSEMARAIQVTGSFLSRIETGASALPPYLARSLGEVTGFSSNEILGLSHLQNDYIPREWFSDSEVIEAFTKFVGQGKQ